MIPQRADDTQAFMTSHPELYGSQRSSLYHRYFEVRIFEAALFFIITIIEVFKASTQICSHKLEKQLFKIKKLQIIENN